MLTGGARATVIVGLLAAACGEPSGSGTTGRPSETHPLRSLFECLMERDEAVIAAHRGGAYPGFPENAIETFAFTTALGPEFLEIDIRQTADGVLVLMHDETLDRTTTGAGRVDETSYAAFSRLLLKDNDGFVTQFHPPSLGDALDWARGRAVLELDIRSGVDLWDVIDAVEAAEARDYVIYIAYTPRYAARIHAQDPQALISAPISSVSDLDELAALGVPAANILAWTGVEGPDPQLNSALEARGAPPLLGTLAGLDEQYALDGDLSEYPALARYGVTLISSDTPDEAHQALAAAGLDSCKSSEG